MKNKHLKILIIILLLLSIICLFHHLFQNKLEAFSVNDIGNMTNTITKISSVAETIPKKITDLEKKVASQTDALDQKITKIEKAIPNTFKSVFAQLGDVFKNGIITPIMVLFKGIGNIFVQLFNIIELIISKIVSLPGCILVYIFVSIYNVFYNIYKSILPNKLTNLISTIYQYTFKIIIDFITNKTGIDASINRCYGFNVDKEMHSMNTGFQAINQAFTQDFGNLDFSQIKV